MMIKQKLYEINILDQINNNKFDTYINIYKI